FVQKSFLVGTDWATFGFGPAHRSFNPYENVISPGNVAGLDEAWTGATGGQSVASPSVFHSVVYVGSTDGFLYAFSAVTHALLWKGQAGAPIRTTPAAAGSSVYVATETGKLYAF